MISRPVEYCQVADRLRPDVSYSELTDDQKFDSLRFVCQENLSF